MYQHDLALIDAERAIQLRPKWSKATARKAKAFSHLQTFTQAYQAYNQAELIALRENDGPASQRFKSAADLMRKKQLALNSKKHETVSMIAPQDHWPAKYEAMLATGTPPAFGSEVESAGQASTLCYNGILELHRVSGINQSNGKFVGSNTDAIQQIVECIVSNRRGLMIPSPAPETREKLFAQRTFELSMNDISHWGDYKLSMVDDIIDEIDKRVQDRGWGHDAFKEPKKTVGDFVRGCVLSGFFDDQHLETE